MMLINELAKLTGLSVRTLHYYDEIGLFCPEKTTDSGYRLYDEKSLSKLQNILFLRELDFPLSEIKRIIESGNYDTKEVLLKHKHLLLLKRDRLERLIDLIDKTVKEENSVSFKEFDEQEFIEAKEKYAKEAKERYSDTDEYKESERRTKGFTKDDWKRISAGMNGIFSAFADNMDKPPEDEAVQKLVADWQQFITENFYNCTKEILKGLSSLYVEDERFTKNIDSHAEGLAVFISRAIEIYCEK